jgi:hypothetical protein
LFDHPDDDIYDGILREDDDEEPRIYIDFIVEESDSRTNRPSDISIAPRQATTRPQTSQEISS